MDIKFDCQGCGQNLEIDEAGAGMEVQCPNCGKALVVPVPQRPTNPLRLAMQQPSRITTQLPPSPMDTAAMRKCPFCAEDILAAAIKCKHCGSNLGDSDAALTRSGSRPVVSPEILSQTRFKLVDGEVQLRDGQWTHRKSAMNVRIGDAFLTSHRFVFCDNGQKLGGFVGGSDKIGFQIVSGQLASITEEKVGFGKMLRLRTKSGDEYQCAAASEQETWVAEIQRICKG